LGGESAPTGISFPRAFSLRACFLFSKKKAGFEPGLLAFFRTAGGTPSPLQFQGPPDSPLTVFFLMKLFFPQRRFLFGAAFSFPKKKVP